MVTEVEMTQFRHAMLNLVNAAWIKGVLEKSLYEKTLIALNVRAKSDFQPQSFSSSSDILDIFDEYDGRLLILGEPGSGKTVTLLDLTRKLIDRAREDFTQPLPVVFHLASWGEKQRSLGEWLINELESVYRMPRSVGRYWVRNRKLVLLLDGLDELSLGVRDRCIDAINAYCGETTKVVVCSRYKPKSLSVRVKLRTWQGILLQPLSKAQIFTYLRTFEDKAEPVARALQEGPDLLELAQTPLLLNVMLMAFGGKGKASQGGEGLIENRRSRFVKRYIRRVFLEHGSVKHPWPPSQVMTWLRWIAQGLIDHNETEFRLENLRLDWLSPDERELFLGLRYDDDVSDLTLPFFLWRLGHMPDPALYGAFFDYAERRILLRYVGGWAFLHHMIMEHIAQLDDEFIASLDQRFLADLSR